MDKEEIKNLIQDEVAKALKNTNLKKTGDTPLESFDLVNRTYLQQHGTRASRPAAGLVGRMYYVTNSAIATWDDGSVWRTASGTID